MSEELQLPCPLARLWLKTLTVAKRTPGTRVKLAIAGQISLTGDIEIIFRSGSERAMVAAILKEKLGNGVIVKDVLSGSSKPMV